jgi:hypothetical protein
MVHHHPELLGRGELANMRDRTGGVPLVIVAHERLSDTEASLADGIVGLCEGVVPAGRSAVIIAHPAHVPDRLYPRDELRKRYRLPKDAYVLGTSGFLRFEREFDRIAEMLLPLAARHGWFVFLCVSPWRTPSPGLVERLACLEREQPGLFRLEYQHIDEAELNRRLQACDLLWCWTRASSRPYASGVVSTHYASGTRMIVARKPQHQHVLDLPNVVAAADTFEDFVEDVCTEAVGRSRERHAPWPVSWDRAVAQLRPYLVSLGTHR